MKQANIWESFETHSWAAGFDFAEYKRFFERANCVHSPLSEKGYEMFCEMHDYELRKAFENL